MRFRKAKIQIHTDADHWRRRALAAEAEVRRLREAWETYIGTLQPSDGLSGASDD